MLQVRPDGRDWRQRTAAIVSAATRQTASCRLVDHAPTVGPAREPPTTFVARNVVTAAQQHAVRQGLATLRASARMVHVAPVAVVRSQPGNEQCRSRRTSGPPQCPRRQPRPSARGRAPPTRPSSPPGTPPRRTASARATTGGTGADPVDLAAHPSGRRRRPTRGRHRAPRSTFGTCAARSVLSGRAPRHRSARARRPSAAPACAAGRSPPSGIGLVVRRPSPLAHVAPPSASRDPRSSTRPPKVAMHRRGTRVEGVQRVDPAQLVVGGRAPVLRRDREVVDRQRRRDVEQHVLVAVEQPARRPFDRPQPALRRCAATRRLQRAPSLCARACGRDRAVRTSWLASRFDSGAGARATTAALNAPSSAHARRRPTLQGLGAAPACEALGFLEQLEHTLRPRRPRPVRPVLGGEGRDPVVDRRNRVARSSPTTGSSRSQGNSWRK